MITPAQSEQDASGSSRATGIHWSKDHVEHLRTIHFSLIALCLGAIVITFASGRSEIQEARREINIIGQLTYKWDPDRIQSEAEARVNAEAVKMEREVPGTTTDFMRLQQPHDWPATISIAPDQSKTRLGALPILQNYDRYSLTFAGPTWFIEGPLRTYIETQSASPPANPFFDIHLERPMTLKQFRDCWNALAQKHTVRIPMELSQSYYVFGFQEERARIGIVRQGKWSWSQKPQKPLHNWRPNEGMLGIQPDWLPKGGTHGMQSGELRLHRESREPMGLIPDDPSGSVYYFSDVGRFVIPIKSYRNLDFIPEDAIRAAHQGEAIAPGPFDRSFPNLDSLAANFGDFDFDRVDVVLKDLQKRTGESFEAFGVKIPAEATARLGILVILAVQLYLWLHLYELQQKLQPEDPGWEVAFIGMYSSLPSQLVYFLSSCVLPIVAIVALGIKGLHVGESRSFIVDLLVLGAATCVALSVAIWKASPRRLGFTR